MPCELDMPSRVLVGADTRMHISDEVRNLGFSRPLIVSDPFHETTGRVAELESLLTDSGLAPFLYTGVTGEPDIGMVELGYEHFEQADCDGIVALGGGSVLDTAKTIGILAANEGPVGRLMGADRVPKPGRAVIALPTTAGTGSEATRVVVIADSERQLKMTGRSRYFVPQAAILDHKLTETMPPPLTATVGIDALTHAIEAFVSRKANDFTDPYALRAVVLLWRSIREACRDGSDERARRDMLVGSFLAGIAFSNASVALVHSMSEPLGACFHVPHGLGNAMLLPAVTDFSLPGAASRYAQLARSLGLARADTPDDDGARTLAGQLYQLNHELGIACPESWGIDQDDYEAQIEKMAADAQDAGSTANNPVKPTRAQITEIYRDVFTA